MSKRSSIADLANSSDPIVADLANSILNQSQGLQELGIDPGPLEPRKSLLMEGLDLIDTPRQWITGIIDSGLRGDLGQQGIFGAAARGGREDISTSDVLRRGGYQSPTGRAGLGFIGDILSDPLTYLTLGTSGLAKAGGTALSTTGKLKGSEFIAKSLLSETAGSAAYGTRMLESSMALDKAGSALGALDIGQREAKLFPLIAKSRNGSTDITAYLQTLTENADNAKIVESVFGEGSHLQVDKLIGRSQRIALEANLPFIGVLDKGDTAALQMVQLEGGPIGEVFEGVLKKDGASRAITDAAGLAGKILAPGKKMLFEKQLGQEQLVRIQQIAHETKLRMGEFAMKADRTLRSVPGGALVSDIAGSAAKAGAAIGDQFKRIFVASYLGPDFEKARTEFINNKAASDVLASESIVKNFGDLATTLEGKTMLRRAGLLIDSAGKAELAALSNLDPDIAESILTKINNTRLGIEDTGESLTALYKKASQIDPSFDPSGLGFNQRVLQSLDAMGAEPELRVVVQRVQDHMDGLVVDELKDGLNYTPLDAYIPHTYVNKKTIDPITRQLSASGPVNSGFLKSRKYNTVNEALGASGLVADTNILNLLATRTRMSLIKRGEAAFARRSFVQGGMSTEQLSVLANSALKGDEGASRLLTGKGFQLPSAATLDDNSVRNLLGVMQGPFKDFNPKHLESMGMSAQEAGRVALDLNSGAISDMASYVRNIHANMFAMGSRPRDLGVPQSILGEIADKVKMPGSTKEVYLPKELARAVRETLGGRDFLKNAAGKSEISQRLLNVSDTAVGWFKRMNTLPWAAYWSQNLIGDQLFKLMDGGIVAASPGYLQKTHGILSGRSAIKTPYGVITPDVFTKALKQGGITFGARDLRGVLDNFDAMDVERAMTQKGGIVARAREAAKTGRNAMESVVEGVKAAQEGMQFAFGDMMRVSHIVHRLERGDTISEAIRLGQDAMLNYRTLSSVEQSLFRRFFMFYGFLGQGTKRMVGALAQRPGDFALQIKAARGAAELFSAPDAAPSADQVDLNLLKSAASAEQVSFLIGKDKTGRSIVGRGFGLPVNTVLGTFDIQMPRNLKLGEVIDATVDSTARTFQKALAASSTPIAKAAELISGKNLYFNKPLDSAFLRKWPSFEAAARSVQDYPGGSIPAVAFKAYNKTVQGILGGVADGQGNFIVPTRTHWMLTSFIPGFSRLLSTAASANNAQLPTGVRALRGLTGIRPEPFNIEQGYLRTVKDGLDQTARDQSANLRREALE